MGKWSSGKKIIRLIFVTSICLSAAFFILQTPSGSKEDPMDHGLIFADNDDDATYAVRNLKAMGLFEEVNDTIMQSNGNGEDYAISLLEGLGYQEGLDFVREKAYEKALSIHLMSKEECTSFRKNDFQEDDLFNIAYRALFIRPKDAEITFIEKLEEEGRLISNPWKDIEKDTIEKTLQYDPAWYKDYFNQLPKISLTDKIYNKPSEEIPESTIQDPLVLIHSTHPYETFREGQSILEAGQKLCDELNRMGIPAILEERRVERIMDENPILLGEYYMATRLLILQQREQNPSLKYKIDLHIDRHNKAHTIQEHGKPYALLMTVVGNGSVNKEKVEVFANRLTAKIRDQIPTLAKAPYIYQRRAGVSGDFGQDLFEKAILVEVGTEDTDFEAGKNSMDILAKAIERIIKEDL